MAEAAFKVLIDNVVSQIQKEIGLIMGVDKEMKKLQSTLSTIQSVLEDAESKQLQNKPLQNWLSKLNDAVFKIEDILDECITELSKLESKGGGNFKYLKKSLFRRKIGRRMKEMTETLVDLAAERHNFHLREIVVPHSSKVDRRRETGFILNEPDHVYGREEDKEKIVGMLVNDQVENLFVLPILGVGGLGKTTLAQLVFNDERVSQHFDAKFWVCVSDNFDLMVLLEAIIVSATRSASNLKQLEALESRVCDLLGHKRNFLVLDDVWSHSQEDWEQLRSILMYASKGLSIIVTTRLRKVADIMGTVSAHSLKGLSEEHLWLLFKLRAFGHEGVEYPNLEAIGRKILKKSVGVPLAAKALGGLLRFKREEKDWIHVRESEIWDLPEEETHILPALRLSYHHLPLELRQCFSYCAVFPKDYKMEKQDLIFRWMAHGFISSNGVQEVEDVGDQVWNEFVLRSIFQEVGTFEGRTTCKMHDLVHDLAHSILGNKVYGVQIENNNSNESCSKVRELFDFWYISSSTMMLTSIMDYTRLRILKIEYLEKLPSEISKLKHLRYLDLTNSEICSLPHTFCSLWNLQILILNDCFELRSLPKHIRYMTNLRHIFLENCFKLSDMPCGIGEMTFLKTLSVFIVGHRVGNQLDQLQHLNLGGSLEIRHLERTKNPTNARNANLVEKSNLQGLVLSWDHGWEELPNMMDEEVVEALEPHPNLKTLEIKGFEGSYFPIWMTKMNNVTEIHIRKCPNCTHISPLCHLPHLKKLFLSCLKGLEYIVDQNEIQGQISVGAKLFPSLEELSLVNLPNLKRLLKEEVHGEIIFLNLQQLEIYGCKLLTLLPLEVLNLERLNLWIVEPPADVSSFSKAKLENLTYLKLDFTFSRTTCTIGDAWEGLCNLRELHIYNAKEENMSEKWFQGVKSLKSLYVTVTNFVIETNILVGWLGHLTALEMLHINNCHKLEEHEHGLGCSKLERLELQDLDKFASLPQALQQLPSLKSIQLYGLTKLTSLPECLPNLTSLHITKCPMLTSLPSSMPNLTSLVILICPRLIKRCKQETGEDWHKIAHVPYRRFGS